MMTADEVEQLASRFLADRYPRADAGFAAGSLIRGDGGAWSDSTWWCFFLRLTLLHAGRASFTFEGLPVDAFLARIVLATPSRWYALDMAGDRPPGPTSILAEGRIVGPRRVWAAALQARARAILAAGPPPLDQARTDYLRYHITDKLDDLRDPRLPHEVVAIVAWLYAFLTEFLFRSRGRWAANAKWAPRQLRAMDPVLEEDLDYALEALLTRHDVRPLIDFTGRALLNPWAGFVRRLRGRFAGSPFSPTSRCLRSGRPKPNQDLTLARLLRPCRRTCEPTPSSARPATT